MTDIIISILQISVSIIFFANKVFVLIGKKMGWLLGVIAAALSIFYFFLLHLYIFTILEVGLVVLMGYGFFRKEHMSAYVERLIHATIIIVMTALVYFVFNGFMTVMEFCESIFMLTGTYYLTHKRVQLGWFLYGCAHIFLTIVAYGVDQEFFANFQIASGIVAFAGCIKKN